MLTIVGSAPYRGVVVSICHYVDARALVGPHPLRLIPPGVYVQSYMEFDRTSVRRAARSSSM